MTIMYKIEYIACNKYLSYTHVNF